MFVIIIPQNLWNKSCVSKISMFPRAELFCKVFFTECHEIHFKLNLIVPRKHGVFKITHQEINFSSRLINEIPKAVLISPSLRPCANSALNHILLRLPIYIFVFPDGQWISWGHGAVRLISFFLFLSLFLFISLFHMLTHCLDKYGVKCFMNEWLNFKYESKYLSSLCASNMSCLCLQMREEPVSSSLY